MTAVEVLPCATCGGSGDAPVGPLDDSQLPRPCTRCGGTGGTTYTPPEGPVGTANLHREITALLASHTPERLHREGVLSGGCTGAMCTWKAPAHTYGQGLPAFQHAFAEHLNGLIGGAVRESVEVEARARHRELFKELALEITALPLPQDHVRGAQAVSLWIYNKGKQ